MRHRLNRSGDRRLNQALHMAVVVRMRMDPKTRAYVERRTAEGRTTKEIRRSLKRYLARQIHRALRRDTRRTDVMRYDARHTILGLTNIEGSTTLQARARSSAGRCEPAPDCEGTAWALGVDAVAVVLEIADAGCMVVLTGELVLAGWHGAARLEGPAVEQRTA